MPSIINNSFNVDSVVLGLSDVRQKMQSLPRQLGINIVRNAVRDGAVVIQEEARRLVPVQKIRGGGVLKRSIVAESDRPKGSDTRIFGRVIVRYRNKAVRNPRSYAHLVEFGTAPHTVSKGSKLKGRYQVRALQYGIQHPGAKPHPFIRPAFDTKKEEALQVVADRIRRDIETAVTTGQRTAPRRSR